MALCEFAWAINVDSQRARQVNATNVATLFRIGLQSNPTETGMVARRCRSRLSRGHKNTIQQLFAKTEVRTRSQLVRVALECYRELL
jgi:hypothetical protein